MKISPYEINKFLSNVPNNIKSLLIYGTDNGLVSERAKSIQQYFKQKHKNINITKYQYDDIKKNDIKLIDNISNMNFFSQFELFIISDIPNKLPADIELVIEKLKSDHFLLLVADELSTSSSLRKYYEDKQDLAIIACYQDDQQTIKSLIINKMKEHNISIASDLVEYMSNNLKGDRKHTLNELEKLVLFVGNNAEIVFEDIKDSCSFAAHLSYDDLNFAVAEYRKSEALLNYKLLLEQGLQNISIIRSLSNYFMRLYQSKCLIHDGMDAKMALKKLAPPVFIMHTNIFLKHMQNYTIQEMLSIINKLYQLEMNCKTTGFPVEPSIENFIISDYKI